MPIRDWQNTYTLFNTKGVEPIYNTHTVLDHVKKLQKNPMFEYKPLNAPAAAPVPPRAAAPVPAAAPLPPHAAKPCPPGKIFNPKTGRCVKADGLAGKLAAFKEAAAKKAVAKEAAAKEAAAKEVAAKEAAAKEAAAKEAAAKEAAAKEAAAKEAAAKKAAAPVKACPPGKVLNPKTLRCVKADGWAGKHIKSKTRKNK